jgi:hypothetical protein
MKKRSRPDDSPPTSTAKKHRKPSTSLPTPLSTNNWFCADKLRVLTLRQPWASSIMYGGKSIENRSWTPSKQMLEASNGWFAVHAGATYESPSKYYTKEQMQGLWSFLDGSTKSDFPLSQILGLAHVSEVKSYQEMKDAPWALDSGGKRGSHCWIIDKVIPAQRGQERLLATKGALGLWKCPTDIAVILECFNKPSDGSNSASNDTSIQSKSHVVVASNSSSSSSSVVENNDDSVVKPGRTVSDLVELPLVDQQPPFDWSLIEVRANEEERRRVASSLSNR